MSTLLVKLQGSRSFNRTIFPPYLYVYDDILIFKRRGIFHLKEMTMSYNQIAHVILMRIPIFAHLEIITTGEEHVNVRFVNKREAVRAKKVIDQKIFFAHAKHSKEERQTTSLSAVERTISRYRELLERGSISRGEFERRATEVLKEYR